MRVFHVFEMRNCLCSLGRHYCDIVTLPGQRRLSYATSWGNDIRFLTKSGCHNSTYQERAGNSAFRTVDLSLNLTQSKISFLIIHCSNHKDGWQYLNWRMGKFIVTCIWFCKVRYSENITKWNGDVQRERNFPTFTNIVDLH